MTYQQTLEWMFSRLPMYQNQGASAYKKDLTNAILLSEYLGKPEDEVKTIHVAGTNGKGSVSNMIASILQEAGYKTGLYTSPHLKDFRERIKINGIDIPEEYVVKFINKHQNFFETNQLSFFEMTVGLAFQYFKEEAVDIAVIEVGMGGRLDSTNIINPMLSVITNIGMDHTQFLGDSMAAIAGEKAGIIKPGIPVVIGEYNEETKPVFASKAQQCHSQIYFASDEIFAEYESDLLGDYQKQNIQTVLQSVELLKQQFIINDDNIKDGLLNVMRNTGFMGRWQKIHDSPMAICDTAHNSHGLKIALKQLQRQQYSVLRIVLGMVNDKDLTNILPLFPTGAVYYFCRPNIPRGLDANVLQLKAGEYNLLGKSYFSVTQAYKEALQEASPDDFIYIGGSTFVVAEVV